MKILVTGGSGFVGSQVVAALVRRGDEVRVLRRLNSSLLTLGGQPVEHVIGDILDPTSVERAATGCDVVFHIAALSSYWRAQREEVYRVNVEGTRVVMEACLRAGVGRVVHTSSVAAIGIAPAGLSIADETNPFDAVSAGMAYAHSKHLAELEVRKLVAIGLPAVIVNPAAVIGPGDHHMISSSIVVEYSRRSVPFVSPGGLCVADVDAIVAGHLAAADRGRIGERYILGGENLTHRQIADTITRIAGRPSPRWTLPAWILPPASRAVDLYNAISRRPPVVSGEQTRVGAVNFYYSSDRAIRELGYRILPFAKAAEGAYNWYLSHGYLKEPSRRAR